MEEYYLNQSVSQECVLLPNNFNSTNCLLKENYLSELSAHPEKALENLGIDDKFEELDTNINTINGTVSEHTSSITDILSRLNNIVINASSDITVFNNHSRNMDELLLKGIYRNCNLGRPIGSVDKELYTLVTIPIVLNFSTSSVSVIGSDSNFKDLSLEGNLMKEYYSGSSEINGGQTLATINASIGSRVLVSLAPSRTSPRDLQSIELNEAPEAEFGGSELKLKFLNRGKEYYERTNIEVKELKTFELTVSLSQTAINIVANGKSHYNWWVIDARSAQGYSPILQVCFSQLTGKYYYRMLYSRNTEVKRFPETMYNDWMTASDFNELNSKISDLQNLLNNVNTTLSNNKADKTDVNNLTTTVSNKADKTIVNELTETVNGLDGRLDTVETILGNLPKQVDLGPYLKKETTNTDNIPKVTVTANSITLNSANIDLQSDSIKLRNVSFIDNDEISQSSINLGNNDRRLHLRGNKIYTYRKGIDNIVHEYEVWDEGNLPNPLYNVKINGIQLESGKDNTVNVGNVTPSLVLTNYNIATTITSLKNGDTYQDAFSKLEKLIDNKQDKINNWDNIQVKIDNGQDAYTRLDNYLLKTDIKDWAKADDKPKYEAEEIQGINAYENKIEKISVNNIQQIINNKTVNLTIPTGANNGIKIDNNIIKHTNSIIYDLEDNNEIHLYKLKFDNEGHVTHAKLISIEQLAVLLSNYFAPNSNYEDVTSVKITPTVISLNNETRTQELTATVTGTNTGVIWTSNNESVATVNDNGLVTAVSNGSFSITATSVSNPNVSDTVSGEVSGLLNVNYYWYAGLTQPTSMTSNPEIDDENFTNNKWHTLNEDQISQTITGGTGGNSWYIAVPTSKGFIMRSTDLSTPDTTSEKLDSITINNISYDVWRSNSTGAKTNVYMK